MGTHIYSLWAVTLSTCYVHVQVTSIMQLEWTAALRDVNKQRHVITAEFLQPYASDSSAAACRRYRTCLACMTDTACAWCNGCVDRLSDALARCAEDVIVNAQYCFICTDHVTCSDCLQVCACVYV